MDDLHILNKRQSFYQFRPQFLFVVLGDIQPTALCQYNLGTL
ncbi:hypothetical protein [Sulfurovum sp. NBC37-1]|nr:hypothetical protein [Sulfurovum sp. NBC37-1]